MCRSFEHENESGRALQRWPPKDVPVAVTGLRWRKAPDHLKPVDKYGAPAPTHVAFVLRIQLMDDITNESKLIVVRWSQVKALHAALARSRWDTRYTKTMACTIKQGKTFTLRWGSCLDATVADKRLSIINTYLDMLLEEPLLRANPYVKNFLAEGRVRAVAWGAATKRSCKTMQGCPLAISSDDAPELVRSASSTTATSPMTVTTRITTTSTRSTSDISVQAPSPKLASTPLINDKRIRQRAEAFSRGYDVRAWLTTGGPVPVAMGIRPPRAPEAEKDAAEALQLLLLDGRLLACFLETRDMKSLSQCCTAWRPVVGQITVLRPRSAYLWGSRWANCLQHRLTNAYDTLQDPRKLDFSGRTIKALVARRERQQAGWNHVFKALEQGQTPHLQTLDMQIEFDNWLFTPRLRFDSTVRLASILSHMPHLLHLDLAGHGIGCKGGMALAEALQHTPYLKYLNLSGNPMGDAGMVAIAESFSKIPKLEFLGVIRMRLVLVGASALAANLKHLPLLKNFAFGTLDSSYSALIIARLATDLPMLRFLTVYNSLRVALHANGQEVFPKAYVLDFFLPGSQSPNSQDRWICRGQWG